MLGARCVVAVCRTDSHQSGLQEGHLLSSLRLWHVVVEVADHQSIAGYHMEAAGHAWVSEHSRVHMEPTWHMHT